MLSLYLRGGDLLGKRGQPPVTWRSLLTGLMISTYVATFHPTCTHQSRTIAQLPMILASFSSTLYRYIVSVRVSNAIVCLAS